MTAVVVAVDFGASSIRVCRVDLGPGRRPSTSSTATPTSPVRDGGGHLRWDWARLVAEMRARAWPPLGRGRSASIGVDTWGVDYGLLDADGELLAPPYSYRDRPHRRLRATSSTAIGEAARSTRTTGIQLHAVQHDLPAGGPRPRRARPGPPPADAARAARPPPDRRGPRPSGRAPAPPALVDLATGDWSPSCSTPIGVDPALLPPIAAAGTRAGDVARHPGPPGRRPRHRVGRGGDGRRAGPAPRSCRPARGCSSAASRPQPDARASGPAANFTNEAGALGGIRFLKNLAGLLADRGVPARRGATRRSPTCSPRRPPSTTMGCHRSTSPTPASSTRPTCSREVTGARSGCPSTTAPPPVVVRCIVESLAAGTAAVLDQLGERRRGRTCSAAAASRRSTASASAERDRPPGRRRARSRRPRSATPWCRASPSGVYADLADARRPPGADPAGDPADEPRRRSTGCSGSRPRSAPAGRVKVAELADELAVSEMTIRRDLDLLAEQGVVQRIRGGAVAVGPQPFAERFSRQARAKDRIAAKLADLVGDGGAIGVDASSTLQRLAGAPSGDVRDLTVVTNGPDTFATLQDKPGRHRRCSPAASSTPAPAAWSARWPPGRRGSCCCGGCSCRPPPSTPRYGTSETTLEEAEVKLALADVAAEVVVAVDSGKLGPAGRGPGPAPRPGRHPRHRARPGRPPPRPLPRAAGRSA